MGGRRSSLSSRVWGRHAPTRTLQKRGNVAEVQSRKGTTFSRIENLWPRDGSCPLHFGERCFTMDIEIKRMSSDTIELSDQLNIVCKRFHVDYLHASEKDKFFVEAVALHEVSAQKSPRAGVEACRCPAVSWLEAYRTQQRDACIKVRVLWRMLHQSKSL